jgi:hypothetical protein
MITSGTILSDAFPETLTLFNRIGIPFVLINHNWEPAWLSEDKLIQLIERLNPQKNKAYMKMEELGHLLWNYANSSIRMTNEGNQINVELDLKVTAELVIDDDYQIEKIEAINEKTPKPAQNFPLLESGIYSFQITIKKKGIL